jgi:hypothetical protein
MTLRGPDCVVFALSSALALASLAGIAPAATELVQWQVVAAAGRPAPGTGAGVNFGTEFSAPMLDDQGRLGFRGSLVGAGVTAANDTALWYGSPQSLGLVAREDQQAPGLPAGVRILSFGNPIFNDGRIAFIVRLTGSGVGATNNQALYVSNNGGTPVLIVRTGDNIPGSTAIRFFALNDVVVNAAGVVAFRAVLTGTGVNTGSDGSLWTGTPGSIELIAREGSTAGIGANIFFGDMSFGPLAISPSGEVEFISTLTGSGAGVGPTGTLWRWSAGTRSVIIRTGQPAPGTPAGTTLFDLFNPSSLAGNGTLALGASISGPGVNPQNSVGIWAGTPGSMQLVARAADTVEGSNNRLDYQSFTTSPYLNTRGEVAFGCTLRGVNVDTSNNIGIAFGPADSPKVVLRSGDDATGFPGLVIGPTFVNRILLNANGQMALLWSLAGPGVDDTNDGVLYVRQPQGVQTPVVREGQAFDLSGSSIDVRTVDRFFVLTTGSSQGGDGRGQAFNAEAKIAARLDFTDGTTALAVGQVLCPADFNTDGVVDFFDVLDFIAAWESDQPGGDFNSDGNIDFFDYLDFNTAFARGC